MGISMFAGEISFASSPAPVCVSYRGMNERDLDEFLNEPGDLFVRQCEQLWQEMWTISNDGEHSMALRKIAEAIFLYLELPGIYDKASAAERDGIQPILMMAWTAIIQPLEDFSEIPPAPHPAGIAEAVQRASELIDALEGMGALSDDENVLIAPSLKVCANMAWQLPKPADRRQPTLQWQGVALRCLRGIGAGRNIGTLGIFTGAFGARRG